MASHRGLSGTISENMKNSTDGTAHAANIQRHPVAPFQVCAKADRYWSVAAADAAPLSPLSPSSMAEISAGTGRAIIQFTNCAAKIPITMVNWLMATSNPRCRAGATSEMYMGAIFDASPMLTPPRIRHATNAVKLPAKAIPIDETTKLSAEAISTGLRPKRSLMAPETSAPARQPKSAQLCAQPTGDTALAITFCQIVALADTSAAVSLR